MNIRSLKPNQVTKEHFDVLVLPLVKGKVPVLFKKKFPALVKNVQDAVKMESLDKKLGASFLIHVDSPISSRIAIINMGNGKTAQEFETAFKNLKNPAKKYQSIAVITPDANEKVCVTACIKMLYAVLYESPHFKSELAEPIKLEAFTFISQENIEKIIFQEQAIQEAIKFAKDLGNFPANKLTPSLFADKVTAMAQARKIKLSVFGEEDMKKLRMGGMLAVSQGSHEEAKVILMEYNPKGAKTVGLVGKGITFDSGGISMKEAKNMTDMKFDMCGGAAVAAIIQAAADLQVPYHLIGIIGTSENLPSGNAIKPRDVIHMMNGKTVEVINTDAEGRLVLGDCMTYIQKKYKVDALIDIATLTGAVINSLGNKISGVIGNNNALIQKIITSGSEAGEPIWQLPLFDEYRDELKSSVADLANLGKNRWDALIAAVFLKEFVDPKIPWAHLDIAGTSFNSDGATGSIISTLINLFDNKKI